MPPTDAHRDAKVVPLRPPPTSRSADLNLRILWSLARWVEDHEGEDRLASLAASAGLEPGELDGRTRWASLEQVERFLEGARALVPDDESFMRACAHRLTESYGPYRFVFWATSPHKIISLSAKTVGLVSRISAYDVVDERPGYVHLRYRGARPESRLMCLSRQAQGSAIPSLWNMPAAKFTESACVARGDPSCEYHIKLHETATWVPAIGGLLLGLGLAFAATAAGMAAPPLWVSLPLLGAAVGHIMELRRTNGANVAMSEEVHQAIEDIAKDDADARQELLALQQRQRTWTRALEEQVQERTATMHRMVARIQGLREERETVLRGFSHDLRNPLAVLRAGVGMLKEYAPTLDEEGGEIVEDLDSAVESMERLLTELMDAATRERHLVRVVTEPMEVQPLVERLRRRLAALVNERDIRVSVFSTREAPSDIETDPLIFDRIVDNLLTNAAKYTRAGSIVVELGGSPGFLVLKVSDTGRGIAPEAIERIFRPGASTNRAAGSYGVGLSVVVGLLGQIGGKLQVMSRVDVGTTFWASFPAHPVQGDADDIGNGGSLMSRVVTIKHAEAK